MTKMFQAVASFSEVIDRKKNMSHEMIHLFYKVDTANIARIKFLLEGYENIFSVSTVDEMLPKIQITVPEDFFDEAQEILKDLQDNLFYMEKIFDDPHLSQGNF